MTDSSIWQYALVLGIGMLAGFVNVVAAGGSLLTMPLLIFMGLPSAVANGTNRIGIIFQNVVAIFGFHAKGVSNIKYSIWLSIPAIGGAFLGARMATNVPDEAFNKILSVVMIMVLAFTLFRSRNTQKPDEERMDWLSRLKSIVLFFGVGLYGGFIQAGVGVLIMLTLSWVNQMTLVKANAIKVFVILMYNLVAFAVFLLDGKVDWGLGLVLASGTSIGGWVATRWSVKKGDVWINRVLILAVCAMAIKLWFF